MTLVVGPTPLQLLSLSQIHSEIEDNLSDVNYHNLIMADLGVGAKGRGGGGGGH